MDPARFAEVAKVERPGVPAPWIVAAIRRYLEPIVRICHRPTLAGTDHLPLGPFLLVANHSAGLGIAEILSFLTVYLREVGPDRPLAGFAHPTGFRVFPLSRALRSVGAIPSTYAAAEQALGAGVPILVFPGGDHETLRPIWQAHRVDFGGRLGFLRIARAAQVPIVPMGIRGSHFTAPVLLRSKTLATALLFPRMLGSKRWAISLLGVIGAVLIALTVPVSWPIKVGLVWLWSGSPLVFTPWVPWTVRMRIGRPIPPSELFGSDADSNDEELKSALSRVQSAVQTLVDR